MGCACALRLCALRVGHRLRVPPRRSLICALWLRQVWRSSTAIDSFAIGYEPKQRRGDVRGALPRLAAPASRGPVSQDPPSRRRTLSRRGCRLGAAKHVHRDHVCAVEDNWAGAHQRDRNGVFCLADRAWGRALWGSSRRHCCRRHCRLLPPATMCPPAPKVVSPPGTRGHTHGRRAGQRVQALSAYACTASAQRAAAIPQIMRPLLQLALFYRAPSPL